MSVHKAIWQTVNSISKPILLSFVISTFSFLLIDTVSALECPLPTDGEPHTVSQSCSPGNPVFGVENADLTISAGQSLTLHFGDTLVFNPNYELHVDGALVISSGASIEKTYMWLEDQDGDGWYASSTHLRSLTQPQSGWVRRATLRSIIEADCNDSEYSETNYCCTPTNGGWSAWSSWSSCTGSYCSGAGTRYRTRTCTNPAPSCGGTNCSGSTIEYGSCSRTSRVAGSWCGYTTSVHGYYRCSAYYNTACSVTSSGYYPPGRKCTHRHNYKWNSNCSSCNVFSYYSHKSNSPTSSYCQM